MAITYERNFWLTQHIGPVRRLYVFSVENQPPISYSGLVTSIAVDSDGDGRNVTDDNCPTVANPFQADTDRDGKGNACDADDDNDGLSDEQELVTGRNPLVDEGTVVSVVTSVLFDDAQSSETTINVSRCNDPRPQVCTLVFQSVCGFSTGDAGCTDPTCPSVEWRTYSNACSACADAKVHGYRSGAC